jgi:thymidine kinase
MWGGKSSWLNSELTLLADIGLKCVKIIHVDDTRPASDDSGSTHNSSFTKITSKVDIIKAARLADIPVEELAKYHTIGVDEAQWFSDLFVQITYLVNEEKMNILVAGLSGNFQQEKFGQVLDLIPKANEAKLMLAKCHECLREDPTNIVDAPFTKRLDKSITAEKDVGAGDKYMAVCRYHYLKNS